jgi:hypothetical protein
METSGTYPADVMGGEFGKLLTGSFPSLAGYPVAKAGSESAE